MVLINGGFPPGDGRIRRSSSPLFQRAQREARHTADVDGDGRPEFFTVTRGGSAVQAWGLNAEGDVVAKSGQPPAPESALPLPSRIPPLQGQTVPYLLADDVDGEGRNQVLLYNNK